jgi:hypothetical protein
VATLAADRFSDRAATAVVTPVAVCLGLWVLGPLAMFKSATPAGGGFATEGSLNNVLALTAMFPLTTFMMAAYDGSLAGLLLGTVGLMIMSMRRRKFNAVTREREACDLM